MKKHLFYIFLILIFDQLTKIIADAKLVLGESKTIINNLFSLTLVYNKGAAWGILSDMRIFFVIITIISVVLLGMFYKKCNEKMVITKIGIVLYTAGAIGNLIDRVIYGYVVDFFDLYVPIINYDFPVFNIADMALVIGVLVIVFGVFKEEKYEV